MSNIGPNFPPTDIVMALGILPSHTTVTSTAGPATSWLPMQYHGAALLQILQGATTGGSGDSYTLTCERSEVASSTGANYAQVPYLYRTLNTTAATVRINASTGNNANWGAFTASTGATAIASASAGQYVQAWVNSADLAGTGAAVSGSGYTEFVRFKITAGTSITGALAATLNWMNPRYEKSIPVVHSTAL